MMHVQVQNRGLTPLYTSLNDVTGVCSTVAEVSNERGSDICIPISVSWQRVRGAVIATSLSPWYQLA